MRLFRIILLGIIILCFSSISNSRARYNGIVQKGALVVKTSPSTLYNVMQTFPSATVTVYLGGTTTIASIYTNNSGTVKANPFTANSDASYFFYADNGFYDIKYSGTGITSPFTPLVEIALSDPSEDYNPKSFGAKCDNSTNDLSAFTAIKTLVGSANSTIDIPKLGPCRIASISFPANITLNFGSSGGIYPLSANTITILGDMIGPNRKQRFYNATAGLGTISFSGSPTPPDMNPLWWGTNTTPVTTNMTAPIQAAINASEGRGKVIIPCGSYLITETLTIPSSISSPPQEFSPVIIEGCGKFLTNLVNKASANKPTILINRDLVTIQNLSFFGDEGFPNDGIKVSVGGRNYIIGNKFFTKGNAIFLEKAQSIFILNNVGGVSSGGSLPPTGVSHILSFPSTAAFVYADIPNGGFINHIVLRDNIDENYNYQFYTSQSGDGHGNSLLATGNQFEGSSNGFKLDGITDYFIAGNYMGEGGTGYTFELTNCRNGQIGPNYLHLVGSDSKVNSIKLTDTQSTLLVGGFDRVYATGVTVGDTLIAGFLNRFQDESSDHQFSFINAGITNFTIPKSSINAQTGVITWYSNSINVTLYPGPKIGHIINKVTPTVGTSPGWVCTTSASSGSLTHTIGTGNSPTLLSDYFDPVKFDFKIIMLSATTYKVQWRVPAGVYADLTETTTITELAHLVGREGASTGPVKAFQIRWPIQTYTSGDTWEITNVVAPIWTPFPSL